MPYAEQCIQSAHRSASSTAAGQRQNTSLTAYKISQKKLKCQELLWDQLHATSKP